MDTRFLGRTGIRVSPLCLGCMMFGGRTPPAESERIIDRAIDAGIDFLDTANVYNDGRSEEVVGEALRKNGHRHHVDRISPPGGVIVPFYRAAIGASEFRW